MDHDLLATKHRLSTVKAAKLFGVPVVHLTVNVAGGQKPIPPRSSSSVMSSAAQARPTWRVSNWAGAVGGVAIPSQALLNLGSVLDCPARAETCRGKW